MIVNELSFMVGGPAGAGIKTAGMVFARLCSQAGLFVFGNVEYPSIIRGDHNSYQVIVSERPVHSHIARLDVLLALDALTIERHKREMRPDGAIIHDADKVKVDVEALARDGLRVISLPFARIAKEAGGDERMYNTIGVGAAMGLLRLDFAHIESALRKSFERLGEKVAAGNIACARISYETALNNGGNGFGIRLETRPAPARMLLSGNDAFCLGALKAGLKFYASYPMTPASSILSFLAAKEREFGIVVKNSEDEISAICMAVGAAYAGARAAAGTSGGGFCLMTEGLGLAAMTETPLVIVEAQRPGPSTGLPTRTAQGDLKFVLSAGQDEFPRVVIAPGDVEEAFHYGFEAFNFADRIQSPVILLLDKHLCESNVACEPFDTTRLKIDRGAWADEKSLNAGARFKRYEITESGVSPRVRPGVKGGVHTAPSDEHDEYGRISEEESVREAMHAKRLRKIEQIDLSREGWKLHGDPNAPITLIGWGSTKGVILDAIEDLESDGIACNFLQIIFMSPFPTDAVAGALARATRRIIIENNATAQLADLICEKTGILIEERILKYSGRQFLRDELGGKIRDMTAGRLARHG